uniref:Uncharacterized protein n=1 Tax=Trichobilharzia regenti TaxID=157069 RepID=A0AA85KDX5_TRIRE|nr:unnamed protein product [Trichobilharzia regenti]
MTENINNFMNINHTNSSSVELLSVNKYVELPLMASYSNAFLETIAEETSELETSENGTFNNISNNNNNSNDIFDVDRLSFCTENDLKACDADLSSQFFIFRGDSNNNNDNNKNNNSQAPVNTSEHQNEYSQKTFIPNLNTFSKPKQFDCYSDNSVKDQRLLTGMKSTNHQLCDSWTLNLPVTLEDKNIFLNNRSGTGQLNSINKNSLLKNLNNMQSNISQQSTDSVNTDTFVELSEDSKENHKKITESVKSHVMSKSQKELGLPLWNDEILDEELLILSTDYDKNQLCWTLTPSRTVMTPLSPPGANEILTHGNIHGYPVVNDTGHSKSSSNIPVDEYSGILLKNNFVAENAIPPAYSEHPVRNITSTFLPFNSIQNTSNTFQTSVGNSVKSQCSSRNIYPVASYSESNLMLSYKPIEDDFQMFADKHHKMQANQCTETILSQARPLSFIPHMIPTNYKISAHKPVCTDCVPPACDQLTKPPMPNYQSIKYSQDFQNTRKYNEQLIALHPSVNGGFPATNILKFRPEEKSFHKGLNDNSSSLNQTYQSVVSDVSNGGSQLNDRLLNQPKHMTNISTFKPVSKDFSYTLSAAHNDFNYSFSIIPESVSTKYSVEEKNVPITKSSCLQSTLSSSLSQVKKTKDCIADSFPQLLFDDKQKTNGIVPGQPITYHHVKSPDLNTIGCPSGFLHSQFQNNPLFSDNYESVEFKRHLSSVKLIPFSGITKPDVLLHQNAKINNAISSYSDEKYRGKHSTPVDSRQQQQQMQQILPPQMQQVYPNSYKTAFNFKSADLFRPLQRSPAVVGVSDLLIKTDAELNSILEKVKQPPPNISANTNSSLKLESQDLFRQKCSLETTSLDKTTPNDGLYSSLYQEDISPARRRFFPHYLTRDIKLNYSSGLSRKDSDDMEDEEEKRSFYDYGCDDEEDEDKLEEEDADEKYPPCGEGNVNTRDKIFCIHPNIHSAKKSTDNKDYNSNNSSIIQRIRDLELQNRWEDDCKHSINKNDSQDQPDDIHKVNCLTADKSFSPLHENENNNNLLSSYEYEDNDMPFIDSDSIMLEFTHLKGLLPRIADLEEITLSSRRSSDGGSPWLGLSQIDNSTRFDQDRSTCELIQKSTEQNQSGHTLTSRRLPRRRRRDYHSYDSSTLCRNKHRQIMWFQRLCGCVRASRSH